MDECPLCCAGIWLLLVLTAGVYRAYTKALEEKEKLALDEEEKEIKAHSVEKARLAGKVVVIMEYGLTALLVWWPLSKRITDELPETGMAQTVRLALVMVVLGVLLLVLTMCFSGEMPSLASVKDPDKMFNRWKGVGRIICSLCYPLGFSAKSLAGCFLRLRGVSPDELEEDTVSEQEIMSMVNEGHERGVLKAGEAEMITNIFEFDDTDVRDIMTHRQSIVGFSADTTLRECVHRISMESNSRFPVYEEDLDNIIGILHLKDVLAVYEEEKMRSKTLGELSSLLREPAFIPGTTKINVLLRRMQKTKQHMAIVVDEYGQTDGLVTMEDILEEIVGNILDEHDDEEETIREVRKNIWICDGLTPLEELKEEIPLPEDPDIEAETLNGLMIRLLDRIPEIGEKPRVSYGGYLFEALGVDGKMIRRVRISPQSPQTLEKSEGA